MSNSGDYIKLFRSLLEWEWYSDINTSRLFIHMLLKANWSEGKFQGTTVPRGSFVSSYPKLAEGCGLTINELRTCLKHLKSTGEIEVKTTNKFSIFTVKNYDLFQGDNIQEHSQSTVKAQSINNPLTIIEEEKEYKEEKNIYTESKDSVRQTDIRLVVERWNGLSYLGIKQVSKLTSGSQRYQRLVARIKEYGLDEVLVAIEKIKSSKFLQGKSSSKSVWVITFDWFVCPNNFPKVHDGNYDDDERLVGNTSEETDDGRQ